MVIPVKTVRFDIESKERHLAFTLDTSGSPGVERAFSVGSLWFKADDARRLGGMLQTIRDIHGCESSIHFSELGDSGARESVAKDWLRLLMKSPEFAVVGKVLVVPCEGFDLSHYGDRRVEARTKALNRVCKSAVVGAIRQLSRRDHVLCLSGHVDGHAAHFDPVTGLVTYLQNGIRYDAAFRPGMPAVDVVDIETQVRKPLAPRNSRDRAVQDLIALTDVLIGAARTAADPSASAVMKRQLLHLLTSRRQFAERAGLQPIPVDVQVMHYRPGARRPTFEQLETWVGRNGGLPPLTLN